MKKSNTWNKTRRVALILAAAAALFTGCGKAEAQATEETELTTTVDTAIEQGITESADAEATKETELTNTPDVAAEQETEEATTDESEVNAADNGQLLTDIEGCETFTQIVDKLEAGQGYANATLDGTDVLLVTSGTYDDLEGHMAAIDAELFYYDNGTPAYLGSVVSGGTAYPIALSDGKILSAGNHFVCKSAAKDGKLVMLEKVTEMFDEDGNATYVYESDENSDGTKMESEEAQKNMDTLFEEYTKAEIISFDTISK